MKLDIDAFLSDILYKVGIETYVDRVSFAAHLFTGLYLSSLHPALVVAWTIYSIYDEFVLDGYKGRDTYYDVGSKLFGPLVYGIHYLVLFLR